MLFSHKHNKAISPEPRVYENQRRSNPSATGFNEFEYKKTLQSKPVLTPLSEQPKLFFTQKLANNKPSTMREHRQLTEIELDCLELWIMYLKTTLFLILCGVSYSLTPTLSTGKYHQALNNFTPQ